MSTERYNRLGGRKMLEKIAKSFYDKIYDHPWISLFFKDIPQERIESQQVDFMQGILGGDKVYQGRLPIPAHKHMYITKDLFDLRQKLLIESFNECKASQELVDAWLKVDQSFENSLIKNSISECEKRFNTDDILIFKDPSKRPF